MKKIFLILMILTIPISSAYMESPYMKAPYMKAPDSDSDWKSYCKNVGYKGEGYKRIGFLANRWVYCKNDEGRSNSWKQYSCDKFYTEVNELGNAICNQQYNMTFDFYFEKKLHCKPKVAKKIQSYDGIQIAIGSN